MQFVSDVKKKDFDSFVLSHSNASFMQSSTWGEFWSKEMNRKPYYVGIVDKKKKLVAAALLFKKELPFGLCYFYSPRGMILDWGNKGLVELFTEEIKRFAKKQKAIYIKIDPEVKLHDLDPDGNVLGGDHTELVTFLKSLGYKHFGFNKNFEGSEPRYTYRLDLSISEDQLFQNFHPTTKKILKRGNPYQFEIYKNADAKIEDFYFTMKETEKREGILYHSIDYYRNFYESLHPKDMSNLYVVKLNIANAKKINLDKQEELKKQIEQLSDEKYKNEGKNKNKKQEYVNQLTKLEKEYQEFDEINEEEVVLSSILTVQFGDTVWTVHGGNASFLRGLNANYFIYYEIIKDAQKNGFHYIDFFGTTGDPKPENPIYGIHLFKKRLGGEYLEYIGEFDLITRPIYYQIFCTLIPFYRKIKRNLLKRKEQ